jgi:hypothetical protein
MKKRKFILIFVFLGLFIAFILGLIFSNEFILEPSLEPNSSSNSRQAQDPVLTKKLTFEKLEIANNSEEKSKGMMYRNEEDFCSNCGILFVFEDEVERSFWMKNCYFPLDIIFLSAEGRILNIAKNTKPNQTEEVYYSKGKAKYVLEVKAGFANEKDLNQGGFLDIENLLNQGVQYDNSF